jgi:hypothetical protein
MERKGRGQESLVEFFVDGYRVSGTFVARPRTLGDAMYDSTTSYLTLREAYVSPIGAPAKITARRGETVLVKDRIAFALTMEMEMALRRDQRYGSYRGPQFRPVYLTLPFFELEGLIRLPGRLDPLVLLSSRTEAYLTLVEVTARLTLHPDITYHGEAALVHKRMIGLMSLRTHA